MYVSEQSFPTSMHQAFNLILAAAAGPSTLAQEDIEDETDAIIGARRARENMMRVMTKKLGTARAVTKFKVLAQRAQRRVALRHAGIVQSAR